MEDSRTASGRGRSPGGFAGWLARLLGAVEEDAVRRVGTAVFFAGAVAWVSACAIAGAVFGIPGFAVVATLLLAHVVYLVVRGGRLHYARQRERGGPATARGDLRESLGCIAAIIVVGGLFAALLMLGLTLFEWAMTR